MSDSMLVRQLEAMELERELAADRKPRVVGRPWWNFALLLVLAGIAVFVYRSPVNDAVATAAPRVGVVAESSVKSFGEVLDGMVARRQRGAEQAASRGSERPSGEQQPAVVSGPTGDPDGDGRIGEPSSRSATTTTTRPRPPTTTTTRAPKPPKPARLPRPTPPPKPSAPTKAQLWDPTSTYFGLSTPTSPFDMAGVDQFAASTGKAPNLLLFFQTWESQYNAWAVEQSWRRGAMPVISWEPTLPSTVDQPTLAEIADGQFDVWIDEYAAAARDSGLPIGMRFAHEMNGRWYPWSEELFGNSKGDYIKAWRHVHDRFEAVGATNVMWIWSPNVVGSRRDLPLTQIYPGNDYVDWMALSGYYRRDTNNEPTFDNTFSESLTALRKVSSKPILLSEVGVGTDKPADRAAWIDSLFVAFAKPENDDLVGFVYFEHNKAGVGESQDWRILAYPEATDAFRRGVTSTQFGAGISAPPLSGVAPVVPAPAVPAPSPEGATPAPPETTPPAPPEAPATPAPATPAEAVPAPAPAPAPAPVRVSAPASKSVIAAVGETVSPPAAASKVAPVATSAKGRAAVVNPGR